MNVQLGLMPVKISPRLHLYRSWLVNRNAALDSTLLRIFNTRKLHGYIVPFAEGTVSTGEPRDLPGLLGKKCSN